MNTEEYLNSCKSCWWQEGGRCYVGEPEREKNGVSKVLAEKKCDKYQGKRAVLGQFFDFLGDDFKIVSEENAKRNDPK